MSLSTLFQDIADRARNHWLMSLICLIVMIVTTVWSIFYHIHVVPRDNKIAYLERKTTSQNTVYIFNVKNIKIGASALKGLTAPAKSQIFEEISESFISAFQKMSENKPPVEINNTPANLVKEGIKVTENRKGSFIVSAPSTTYTGTSATIFYKASSNGSSWQFIPIDAN